MSNDGVWTRKVVMWISRGLAKYEKVCNRKELKSDDSEDSVIG